MSEEAAETGSDELGRSCTCPGLARGGQPPDNPPFLPPRMAADPSLESFCVVGLHTSKSALIRPICWPRFHVIVSASCSMAPKPWRRGSKIPFGDVSDNPVRDGRLRIEDAQSRSQP